MNAPTPSAPSAPFAVGGRWTQRRVIMLVVVVLALFAIAYGLGRVLGPVEHRHDHKSSGALSTSMGSGGASG